VRLTPWMRPQEKGIDLVIGLDVVEFLLTRICDVAIIVSLDRDLYEIPQAVQNLGRLIARPVRLEAAVLVPDGQKQPKILPKFSYTHQVTRQVFERIRDDTDYTVTDSEWTAPTVPKTLPPQPTCSVLGAQDPSTFDSRGKRNYGTYLLTQRTTVAMFAPCLLGCRSTI
jgi:hypothetical protein